MATPKTLTTEECDKLLYELAKWRNSEHANAKAIRNYTIALLMLDAGLRVGEVVQLRISDLIFNSVPVTSIIVRPEIAKNKMERIIPVSHRLSNAFKKIIEFYWSAADKFVNYWAFGSLNASTHVTTRQVERIIRAAAMKALGHPVHPHVLRHTFASRLMRTTNARIVQELLGHKQLSSTQIYTHPNQEDLKKAIRGIEYATGEILHTTVGDVSLTDAPNHPDTSGTDRDMG